MKQVVAIVKPFLAERILEGLRRAPLEAVHVREVKGMGRQKSYLDEYAESEYAQAFLPKVEITAWVDDARAEEVIRKMVEAARTGRMGDGKIFVLSAQSVRGGARRRGASRVRRSYSAAAWRKCGRTAPRVSRRVSWISRASRSASA